MKKRVVIGMLGHTDHGKTTLVRMLGKGMPDSGETPKESGITVDITVFPYRAGNSVFSALIDMPGHHRYVKNVVRGLSHAHMAILVVAADDGMMPQTIEHIKLISSFNISHGLVVISKTDLVDDDLLEMAVEEVRDALTGTSFQDKAIIPYSSITHGGLEHIRRAIEEEALKISDPDHLGPFTLWIDTVRQFKGFGTVACGTVVSGRVSLDQPFFLFPGGVKTKARTLEVHHEKVDHAVAGQRVGINLPNVSMKEVAHGMLLTERSSPPASCYINAKIERFGEIKNHQRVNMFVGTSFVNALFTVIEKESGEEGRALLAQLRLAHDIPCFLESPILLLDLHDNQLIGKGTILEISSFRYRTVRKKETVGYLSALLSGDVRTIIRSFFYFHKKTPSSPQVVATYTGLELSAVRAAIYDMADDGEVVKIDDGYFLRQEYEGLLEKIIAMFKKIQCEHIHHTTLNREMVYDRLKFSVSRGLFKAAFSELIDRNKVMERGKNTYELSNFQLDLSFRQKKIVSLLQDYATESGMVPFSKCAAYTALEGICERGDMKNIIQFLCNEGKIIRLKDDIYISADAVSDIKDRVHSMISINGKLHLADSKKILGCGRTKGVFVFEYLDRIGFTCRVGDDRYLG